MSIDWSKGWLFLFLLIPIVIHLLNFVRTKTVYFSRVRFIGEVKDERNKLNTLKRILVLILRVGALTALIAGVILVFNNDSGKKSSYKIVFIDNSPTSELRSPTNVKTIDLFSSYLNAYDFKDQDVALNTSLLEREGLYFSKEHPMKRLASVSMKNRNFTFQEIMTRRNAVCRLADIDTNDVGIVVLSDFQKNIELPSSLEYQGQLELIIPEVQNERTNLIIDSVYLGSRYVVTNQSANLFIKYHTIGNAKGTSVKLLVNDVQSGGLVIEEAAGEVELDFTLNKGGVNQCELRIEDETNFDNSFYFTVLANEMIDVAILSNDSTSSYTYKALSNEEVFNVSFMPQRDIELGKLLESDIVVLEGLTVIPESLIETLNKCEDRGKVITFVPNEVDNNNDLTGWVIDHFGGKILKDSSTYNVPSYDRLFLSGVFDGDVKAFDSPKVGKKLKLESGKFLLTYGNGDAFLSQKGNVFAFTDDFSSGDQGFHKHALFVPFIYKIAYSASKSNEQLSFYLNEKIKIKPQANLDGQLQLKAGETSVSLDYNVNQSGEIIVETSEYDISPGFYQTYISDSLITTLAINNSKSESDTRFHSLEELKEQITGEEVRYVSVSDQESIEKELRQQDKGIPFWKYSLTLSLVLLLLEILVIKYWR